MVVGLAEVLTIQHIGSTWRDVVTFGLLVGILLSRVFSGLVAQLGGWRTVLVVAAGVGLALGLRGRRRAGDGADTGPDPTGPVR